MLRLSHLPTTRHLPTLTPITRAHRRQPLIGAQLRLGSVIMRFRISAGRLRAGQQAQVIRGIGWAFVVGGGFGVLGFDFIHIYYLLCF